ncbi:MAG: DUF3467 domain-containing protein [Methanosarcinales archaeon]|nr:DUF3467 domain-containing protein [Methanosarcinales archaeon]MCK4651607.1 DUF3467 domain-containing protein [Methanosarcinales archaeon]
MIEEDGTVLDIYTNNAQLAASVYEIVISFGLGTLQRDGKEITKEIVKVRMSPQHAMALRILLDKYLKAYGDTFKEILLPDDLLMRLSGDTLSEETGGE